MHSMVGGRCRALRRELPRSVLQLPRAIVQWYSEANFVGRSSRDTTLLILHYYSCFICNCFVGAFAESFDAPDAALFVDI